MTLKKEKICAILQPHYLPWIGYFEMFDRVDIFVFLDDVQFIKREWKNRNKIRKTHNHPESKWLSVPVKTIDQRKSLNQVRLVQEDWPRAHLDSIASTYGKTPFFSEVFSFLESALKNNKETILSELNIGLIHEINSLIGIKTEHVKSSDIGVTGKREEKILNICKAIGSGYYMANNASANYIDPIYFSDNGIEVFPQNYTHPVYDQIFGQQILTPLSHLSVIDLLFNVGFGRKALETIRLGRRSNLRL